MNSRIKISVQGLISSKTTMRTFALLLGENSGTRRVTIIIGPMEAEAIALQLQGITPPRPLTHDLLLNMIKAFDIQILEVNIHRFENGIFYSELLLLGNEKTVVVDARTSDAIALAVRDGCPIFMDEAIFNEFAIEIEDTATENEETEKSEPEEKPTLEELEEQLQQAVAKEQYEEAARLRDVIKSLTKP